MNNIVEYSNFLNENNGEGINVFASNRLQGASDIAKRAKEKGGDAMLTFHHFDVKLPYYKQVAENKWSEQDWEKKLAEKMQELEYVLKSQDQVEFQKVMGEIEVIGEILIKNKETK
jgi:arabinogalactan endo-1,4-beta-galactosidase